jgi:hypothetical protein
MQAKEGVVLNVFAVYCTLNPKWCHVRDKWCQVRVKQLLNVCVVYCKRTVR